MEDTRTKKISEPTSQTKAIRKRTDRKSQIHQNRISRRKTAHYIVKKEKENDIVINGGEEEVEQGSDEKSEVEKKIQALQNIVPGGESLGAHHDKLFEKTAAYILTLQCQVKAMRALSCFFESLDKDEMTKLGG